MPIPLEDGMRSARSARMKYDAIVIGAGVAGLAAARELSGAGKRVCLLEARARAGGRIHTLHVSDLPTPIELGAEFVHGDVHTTFAIVEAAALAACELPDNHWWSEDGRWSEIASFWDEMDRVRAKIGRLRSDVSFADFLRRRRDVTPRLRKLALGFVEGYHAAHADRISAMALSSADEEQDDASGNKQFRLIGGYDGLVEWLRAGLDPDRADVHYGTVVRSVNWRNGDVIIECTSSNRTQTFRASAAILTIPIGVWKAPREQEGAIRFEPELSDKRRALETLEIGHVVKLMLRFRERFWDGAEFLSKRASKKVTRHAPLNFVHSSDRFVQTWWTAAPVRSPILTAWSGGHAADALLAEGEAALTDRILDSLSRTFAMRRRTVDDLFVSSWTHDWQSDPFSRGAYSYAGVGGTGSHKALSRPVRNTLFFAGEATSSDQTGTVAGALESGRRAAREVLRGR